MKTIDQIQKIKAVVEYILQHFNNGVDFPRLVEVTERAFEWKMRENLEKSGFGQF